uniref:PAM2 domain-containing protein n=1 Tax=Mesocestoides corti TaxID=53468 RepID=A0A5K3FH67_MESCO
MGSVSNSNNGTNGNFDHDDEFVVPHMDISCLQNSFAYQRVLEEPWTYIHNWDTLTVTMQQAVMQSFIQELQEIKTGLAYTEGVYVGEAGDTVSPPPPPPPHEVVPDEPASMDSQEQPPEQNQ